MSEEEYSARFGPSAGQPPAAAAAAPAQQPRQPQRQADPAAPLCPKCGENELKTRRDGKSYFPDCWECSRR